MAGELPPGFTLDQPQGGGAEGLPPGFTLDEASKKTLLQKVAPGYLGPFGAVRMYSEGVHPTQLLDKAAYNSGGWVTDKATQAGASPEVAAGAGYATNVGIQALPTIAGAIAGSYAQKPMQAAGRNLMERAVKPPLAAKESGDAARAIDTMLQEGVNPTQGGVDALRSKIGQLNTQVEQLIANSPESVKVGDVGKTLAERWNNVVKQATPEGDLSALRSAWAEFRNHPIFSGQEEIPVQLANELKKGTYRKLGEMAYGEEKSSATETLKQLARGLKNVVSEKVPESAPLLSKESDLINAADIAQRRAFMSGNTNLTGFAALAKNPKAALGYMADKSDVVKSLLARALYSGSGVIPKTLGAGAGAYMGYKSGISPDEEKARQELVRQLRQKLGED